MVREGHYAGFFDWPLESPDARRGGGGDGPPIVRPIGVMMMMAFFAVCAHLTKQVNIAAALLVGILFGAFELNTREETELSFNNNARLVELGNALVLFFAGLGCETQFLTEYWRVVVFVGTGYAIAASCLFALLGWGSGLCEGMVSVMTFGICCSLSSRQLMRDYLEGVHQLKTMHGRILQGLALFQDMIALLAMTLIFAVQRTMLDLDCRVDSYAPMPALHFSRRAESIVDPKDCWKRSVNPMRRAGGNVTDISTQFPSKVWHDRFILGDEIGRALLLTAVACLVAWLLSKHVLRRVFLFLSRDGEMLFIGTVAYNLGASAICYQIGISPMAGAYLAGASLAQLPTRHLIINKIASLRGYGMTTFYFMMGIYVHLDAKYWQENVYWSILISVVNVAVTPLLMMPLGFGCGLKSRTTLNVALLSNSLGETTLTLRC